MPNLPDGTGSVYGVSPANPGPGADITMSLPAATRRRILAVSCKLVTDAVPGSRTMALLASLGSSPAQAIYHLITTPPSTTNIYYWLLGVPDRTAAQFGYCFGPLPDRILISGTGVLRITSLNGAIGDELSEAHIIVEEWVEP